MSKINDGGPAYPVPSDGRTHGTEAGMSLRDHFAGLAMQALIATGNYPNMTNVCASDAYEYADAMIRARGGTNV